MTRADETDRSTGDGRDFGSVVFVAACVVAVILATAMVPFVTSGDGSETPAESLVPVPKNAEEESSELASSANVSGFGALNVGDRTSVGGPIGSREGNSFRSQDTAVHFRVRSEEPGYWRTGAFDTYTGSGWSQSGESDDSAPIDGRRVRYRVTLERSATSAPTVWRPTEIDGADGINLTGGGLARADDALSAGTTYTGVSRKPPRDPSVLATSGRDYPADIADRYTELPAETRQALEPITNNLTAGASSPYRAATRIEAWLESTKEYSLNVSRPAGEDIATQFVTEMDAGYCEYFATAMVAMLRTQGIPARYVVGYSTGQAVGGNTYRVRAMNAHAWVEVFFADVGWVRFDPTPGQQRLREEREAFQNSGLDGSYAPQEEGSPNETFSPFGAANGTDGPNGTDTPTPEGPSTPPDPPTPGGPSTPPGGSGGEEVEAYEVTLNRTAVPGATVEISVLAGAQPVVGADVWVNDEFVGTTDRAGTVVTTVPYAANFTVTVRGGRTVGSNVSGAGPPSVSGDPRVQPESAVEAAAGTGTAGADDGHDLAANDTTRVGADNGTTSFPVETNATLSISGDVRPGATVVVTATVGGVSVPGATVFLDGQRIGETGPNGRDRVTLPAEPGNVTIRVVREPVAGERTVEIPSLSVSADPVWPLPVGGTAVKVTATVGDDPAVGVPVRVGGERVGETGINGTVTAILPFESSVPVVVESGRQTVRTTVSNPLVNAAGVFVVGLVVVLASGLVLTRRREEILTVVDSLTGTVEATPRVVARTFVGLAFAVGRTPRALVARASITLAYLRALVRGERSVGSVVDALRVWLESRATRLRSLGLESLDGAGPTGDADDETELPPGAYGTVREAWKRFLDRVSVGDPGTKTPGQIATHAVSDDELPPDAVTTLRDEFRAVEYGSRSPDDSVPAVASAIARIERTVDDDQPGERPGSDTQDGDATSGDDATPDRDATSGDDATPDRDATPDGEPPSNGDDR